MMFELLNFRAVSESLNQLIDACSSAAPGQKVSIDHFHICNDKINKKNNLRHIMNFRSVTMLCDESKISKPFWTIPSNLSTIRHTLIVSKLWWTSQSSLVSPEQKKQFPIKKTMFL
jgi:hypothetical protein